MTGSVGIIMFSTIYLGIHWLTDMVAGIILAIISFTLANLIFELVMKPALMKENSETSLLFVKKESISQIKSEDQTN